MSSSNPLASHSHSSRIRIRQPEIRSPEEEGLWKEVVKYAKLVPHEPEPNMGRVQEIKEEIKKGNYLNSEKSEQTAARLVGRFMRKE